MLFLNKNNFISQNRYINTETIVMGSGNILWTFELDHIIFIDFTGIKSLKYKEIRVSGAKLFFEEYISTLSSDKYKTYCLLDNSFVILSASKAFYYLLITPYKHTKK